MRPTRVASQRLPGARVTGVLGALGALATVGVVVYLQGSRDISSCSDGRVVPAPLSFIYLVACVGAFAVGGWVTRWTRQPPPDTLGRRGTPPRTILQILLTLVLLILMVLLGYEAWSLSPLTSRPAEFWPITYFVRCASRLVWLAALPIVVAMCGFFGKWLWYRPGMPAT